MNAEARSGAQPRRRRGQTGPRAITLQDVAGEAGVSVSTASRVLNGSEGSIPVRATKADAVRRAADRLGYRTNLFAQAMAKGQATVLGIALTDLTEWRTVSRGVKGYARSQGLAVISSWTDGDPLGEQVRVMLAQGVQTLVVSCSQDVRQDTDALAALSEFRDAGRGVCVLGCPVPGFSAVEDRSAAAAVRVASIAFAQGFRSPLVLGGGVGSVGRAMRARDAFLSTWREFGGDVDAAAGADVRSDEVVRATVSALTCTTRRTDFVFVVEPDLLDCAAAAAVDLGGGIGVAGVRYADRFADVPPGVIAVAVIDRVAAARRAAELASEAPHTGPTTTVEPLRVEFGPAGRLPAAASQ
jgi:LacI family transcriptional regulator